MRFALLLLFLPLFTLAQDNAVSGSSTCRDSISRIVNQAMTIIQRDYYRKTEVDWNAISTTLNDRVQRMESCEEAASIMSWCFSQLNEKHSYLMPPAKASEYTGGSAETMVAEAQPQKPALNKLVGKIIVAKETEDIGYLTVPWISTTNPEVCTKIADSLQRIIEQLDQSGVSKWIIDLRANTGGNCWPMIAGMGPLLGEGVCGYFVFPDKRKAWVYKEGAAMHDANIIAKTSGNGYKLKTPVKQIAVLVGPNTSSSGEILALAFKGKSNTTLFGLPTAGFTTANSTYTLRDNSILVLSVCKEADRSGVVCDGKIIPDQQVTTPASFKGDDPVRNTALMWLSI